MAITRDPAKSSAAKWAVTWRARLVPGMVVFPLLALVSPLGFWGRNPAILETVASHSAVLDPVQIPVGTVLPVQLETSISAKDAHPGGVIEARIAQDVPLPNRDKIRVRSLVKGSIVSVVKDSDGVGVNLTLKFNQLEDRKETFAFATSLRAIASLRAVRAAQMPYAGADTGTPSGWGDTVQIGGDLRFGDGGPVRNRAKQKVGKGVSGGVLVHVRANPSSGCDGPVNGDDHPQALWVFSSDACGVHDLKDIRIVHSGKTAPPGEITLHFEKDDRKLESGTGMLLRVVSQS
jgi:hypothetical protein